MDRRAIIFARWVLSVHVLLLLAVVGTVFFAVRDVYHQTRQQTLDQAIAAQELLSDQTADGIETLYDSIRNDLDLLRRADRDDALTALSQVVAQQVGGGPLSEILLPVPMPPVHLTATTRPFSQAGAAAVAGLLRGQVSAAVAALLWRQLESRASTLFVVEADEIEKYETIEKLTAAARGGNPPVRQIGPLGSNEAAVQVAFKMRHWFKGVNEPSISKYEEFGGGVSAGNLVCFPAGESPIKPRPPVRVIPKMGERNPGPRAIEKAAERAAERMAGRRMLVAVVPIADIRERFLNKLNRDERVNASVADEGMVTMVSSDPGLIGINAAQAEDPHVRELAQTALRSDRAVTVAIEEPYKFGNVVRHPRLFTMQPIDVLNRGANRGTSEFRWWLMISSPLSDVDAVVRGMFRKALYWAIGVVISMTAILVSTAVWLIRGRLRLERVQHDLLTRELNQAREIQLAWLPNKKITTPHVDLAANNTPASHISGDFYNWFELKDGRLVVTIGDVTGHGMSAAFLMATTQLLVRTTMMRVADPGMCLDEVNRQLCTQVFIGQFVSMLVVVIDVKHGEIQVASAGHYPPLLFDGQSFEPIPAEPDLVLGVEMDVDYRTETFALPERASLLMYTDGVLDALNVAGERFRDVGLRRSLAIPEGEEVFESAETMIQSVLTSINRFRGNVALPDDLTLVAIQLSAKATPHRPVPAAV